MPTATTPAASLQRFIARFRPEVARVAKAALAKLQRTLPAANRLVYDNYNALAIGFSPTERASDVVLSIAVYPRWVSLFLFGGQDFDDPQGLLKGSGNTVRHLVLEDGAKVLDRSAVKALMAQAIARSETPLNRGPKGRLIIKVVVKKQRPRR